MFALDDLSRLFNLTVREDAAGRRADRRRRDADHRALAAAAAGIGGRPHDLPACGAGARRARLVRAGGLRRPRAGAGLGTRLELRKPSRLILLGDIRMPRVAARVEPIGTLTRVTFDVAPPTPHTVAQEGSRLLLRFDADALDATLPAGPVTESLQAVHLAETPQVIALDLGPRFASFRVADQPGAAGAARIVVDLVIRPRPRLRRPRRRRPERRYRR